MGMILLFLLSLLTACEKPTEPELQNVTVIPENPYYVTNADADWKLHISFVQWDGTSADNFTITAEYLKDQTYIFDSDEKAYIIINDNPIELTFVNPPAGMGLPHFIAQLNLNPGSVYNISFKFKGKIKMATQITIPFFPTVIFPAAYSQHATAVLNWELTNPSQYQFVDITSFDPWINGGDCTIDRFRVKLNTADRTYTFPADCVLPSENDIAQTGYTFTVSQLSCKIVNRIMLLVGTYDTQPYYLFNDNNIPSDPDALSPTNTDWVVAITQNPLKGRSAYTIVAKYLDTDNPLNQDDLVTVVIGSQAIQLTPLNSIYFHGTAELIPGADYSLTFGVNGSQASSIYIRIPREANPNFPATYDPTQPVELSWTLSDSNQYQFLELEAFCDDGTQCGLTSTYFRQLAGSTRYFYIPPGVVENYGAGTEYTLSLKQLNYYVENRLVLMLLRDDQRFYYAKGKPANSCEAELIRFMDSKIGN
jgi:hypothetical protein